MMSHSSDHPKKYIIYPIIVRIPSVGYLTCPIRTLSAVFHFYCAITASNKHIEAAAHHQTNNFVVCRKTRKIKIYYQKKRRKKKKSPVGSSDSSEKPFDCLNSELIPLYFI